MKNIPNEVDYQIITQCTSGHRQSQQVLYNFLAPDLYVLCLKHCRNQKHAEELLVQTFVQLFNKLCEYSGRISLHAWSKKIFMEIIRVKDKRAVAHASM